ncbi:MAG TPA: hypothetical protein VGK73_12835, partial [Polyangiaceae bacterium]
MTDEQRSDPKLVLRAEALVTKLSTAEPDWEALAARVDARLSEAPGPDDALLAAPLPEAEGESPLDRLVVPRQAPAAAAPRGEAVSLADLARASVARRGGREAQKVAKEALAVATQRRVQGERVAERAPAVPARPAPSSQRRTSSDSRGTWIGVAIASVGLAAGFGLYFAGQRRPPEIIVQQPALPAAVPAQTETRTEPERGTLAAKPGDVARTPTAQVIDPLPAAAPEASAQGTVAGVAGRAVEPVAKAQASSKRPFGAGVAAERVVLEEDQPGVRPGPAAKPAESAPLVPAELNPGVSSGDRPSTGAAQAAVGAVLGAARACIAGHSAPSSATLVFGSSGEVQRVSVSGPAAGTPAAACVESALKKARVQPFAADS